jgi:hypothetical protein
MLVEGRKTGFGGGIGLAWQLKGSGIMRMEKLVGWPCIGGLLRLMVLMLIVEIIRRSRVIEPLVHSYAGRRKQRKRKRLRGGRAIKHRVRKEV